MAGVLDVLCQIQLIEVSKVRYMMNIAEPTVKQNVLTYEDYGSNAFCGTLRAEQLLFGTG